MALFLTPRSLIRYSSFKNIIIRNTSEIKQPHGQGPCSIPEPPECPPCEPAPRPVCRPPEPAHGPRGLRRVCCAPSSGQRPPCTPTPTACSKSCRHAKEPKKVNYCGVSKCRNEQHEKCGDSLDRVARRLAAAELTRRLDYEREVLEGNAPPRSDPIYYNLVGERECIRATDGNDYTTSKQPITQTRCGPCRTPPPPCPVRLDSDDNCKINHGQHLEPCAHRPRIFIEIDRSQNSQSIEKSTVAQSSSKKDETSTSSTSPHRPSTSGSLTTRIIETFRSSRGSCPRRSCKSPCTDTSARHAGDTSWCANIPPPASVPANCKEPSLTERLRRRSCSKPCGTRHRIHTKTCAEKASETKPNTENIQSESTSNKLESILNERSKLKEAGLGRVVATQQKIKEKNPLQSGVMELQIPPTSDSVRVRVSLNFENSKATICEAPSTTHIPISQNLSSCSNDSSVSWLSIKNLQKKFKGRKYEPQQTSEKTIPMGSCGSKSQCGQKATKEPCIPRSFGEIGPRGEASKFPIPLTHGPQKSTCPGHLQREPPRCSIKQDFLNTII